MTGLLRGWMRGRRVAWAAAGLSALLVAPGIVAQESGAETAPPALPEAVRGESADAGSADVWLAPERYEDWAYGLSLRPPKGARAVVDVSPDVVGAWRLADGGRLTLRAHPTTRAVNLERAVEAVVGRVAMSDRGLAQVEHKVWGQTDAGHPGVLTIVRSPGLSDEAGAPELWVGHGLIRVLPTLLIELVYEAGDQPSEAAEATARAMLRSVDAAEPGELDAARRDALRWAQTWRQSLPAEPYAEMWSSPRTFVVERGGRVVGAARVAYTAADASAREPARALRAVSQWIDGPEEVATRRADFRVTPSGEEERWSVRTERLRVGYDGGQPGGRRGWAETGVRGPRLLDPGQPRVNRLVVDREGAPPTSVLDFVLNRRDRGLRYIGPDLNEEAGAEAAPPDPTAAGEAATGETWTRSWPTPGVGYLDQVDRLAGIERLPRSHARTFQFYAYDPSLATLTLHRAQIEPLANGGARVEVRPGPSAPVTAYGLGPDGRLAYVAWPDGLTWRAAPAERVRALLSGAGVGSRVRVLAPGGGGE
ncbi:MAG: hypothetical protein AAF612_11240 [Planctomycetota bacterium]